jgi:hypothetical protein
MAAPLKDKRDLNPDELWSQLGNALEQRSSEDQVLWNIFGIFWAASALLLVALVSSGEIPKSPVIGLIVCAAGVLMCYVWYAIQNRALAHIMRCEHLSRMIEESLDFDPRFAISPEINAYAKRRFLSGGPSARRVMPFCPKLIGALWFGGLAYFLWLLL